MHLLTTAGSVLKHGWCRWLYVRNNTDLSISEMYAQINNPLVREPSIASLTHGILYPGYSADDWVTYLGTGRSSSTCTMGMIM